MADDTNIPPAAEIASADAASKTKEKRNRAPRKPKVAVEAVADTAVSAPVKRTRGPGKKSAAAAAAAPSKVAPPAKASAATKKATAAKPEPAKPASRQAQVSSHETDGFADLLKLEEENRKLRKALSEKLRTENADLRKKLGLA